MAVPQSSAAISLAVFFAAAGCASGPSLSRAVTVESGRRTTVKLVRFGTGADARVLTLQNASSGSKQDVYTDPAGDPFAKVVSDDQLQRLLDVFAEKGLFAGSGPRVPSAAPMAILVEQNGRRQALHGAHADRERNLAFTEAFAYFMSVYNAATAYHSADISSRQFKEEGNRRSPRTTTGGDGQ